MAGKQLVLFDIDGTILRSGALPRQLMNEAVKDLAGASPDLQVEEVAGFTDPMIIRAALRKVRFNTTDVHSAVESVLRDYLVRLKRSYPSYKPVQLYEDSMGLVHRCKREGWHVGLLTGNLQAGAKIKLDRFNIWGEFDFGVFGDDASAREDLLWMAPEIAWDKLGEAYTHDRMVIVGDTPNDARVAYLNGVRSLIVCRRPEWRSKIESQNPTWIVDSLEDVDTLIHWLKEE